MQVHKQLRTRQALGDVENALPVDISCNHSFHLFDLIHLIEQVEKEPVRSQIRWVCSVDFRV
jgi:hypothetical protein